MFCFRKKIAKNYTTLAEWLAVGTSMGMAVSTAWQTTSLDGKQLKHEADDWRCHNDTNISYRFVIMLLSFFLSFLFGVTHAPFASKH